MLVVTSCKKVARFCNVLFAAYCMLLKEPIIKPEDFAAIEDAALEFAVNNKLCVPGAEVVVMCSTFAT